MVVLLFVPLLIAAPLDNSLWSCGVDSASVFTNRPAASEEAPCTKASLDRAPYSRVPREFFEQEVKRLPPLTLDHLSEIASKKSKNSASPSATATWSAKQSSVSSGGFGTSCVLTGKVHALRPGPATLIVNRGGATTDELPMFLSRGSNPWELTLRGQCRAPTVTVQLGRVLQ